MHRIAIIGIGNASKPHLAAIADIEDVELVGGSCRGEDKGRKFESEQGAAWYPDYQRMLDDAEPDVAIVCTPSGAHAEAVRACCERGVHILCEKPLEISTAKIDTMTREARDAGVLLGGVFQQRYNPAVRAVRDAAEAGRFGRLAVASAVVPWWRDDAYYGQGRWQGTAELDGGGALMNQTIHAVDALQWIVSAAMPDVPSDHNPVESVFAFTAQRGHDPDLIEVEDAAVAVLRFRDGSVGQVLATTAMYPGSLRRLLIGGRGGTAEVAEDDLAQFHFRDSHPDDEETLQELSGGGGDKGGAADPMAFSHHNHLAMLRDFLAAVEGEQPLPIPPGEARKAVAIIEACYRSANSGHAEPVA